ncbi:MAG TPA: hypothetical protein VNO30_37700 [Kofleriaceae bacterium]|nr:hypothetical protein [Kofleriaceae bacterium]
MKPGSRALAAAAALATAAAAAAALAGCRGHDEPADAPPAWDKRLPDARELGARRGLVPARGIVHLHSPYSHDACDGAPRDAAGAPNEPCLADLRAALCQTRTDFAALTDHDDTMADEGFATLLSMREADRPLTSGAGEPIASRMTCPDGHAVTFTVGGENELMPIMLERHVAGTVAERHATYNGEDAAAVAAFHAAGGLVWVAHTESKSLALLRAVAPDGIEVYNLHANIDPDIRRDFLGLPPAGAIAAAAAFADTNPGHPEPDLALLAFLEPNRPAIDTWHTLLGEGRHLAATAGSDAHQNAIPITFADGERGDSYRRVLRWFSNIALVADPGDPAGVKAALRAGRLFTAIEVLGSPVGFDVRAQAAARTYELGDVIPRTEAATLLVDLPAVHALDPALPAPEVRARVIRIETPAGAVTELAAGAASPLAVPLPGPGAYRVEVTIVPRHLGPYLGDLGPAMAERELPWLYASPLYVE